MKKPSWLVLLLSFLLTLVASASFAAGADAPSPAFMRAEIDKANPPPSTYDLRDEGRMPPARLHPFGGAWERMAITSLESSAITQGLASADIDLSEMYLKYFTYGDTRPGKSFSLRDANLDILAQSGDWRMATAFLSRQGAIYDTTLPFPLCNNISNCGYTPPAGNADSYAPTLQLQETLFLGSVSENNRDAVKQIIMEHGAVAAEYSFAPTSLRWHGDTAVYFNPNPYSSPGYIYSRLVLVGWDDNFARALFGNSSDTWPSQNGAWLVRGTLDSGHGGNDGYYWVSYEQPINNGAMFIAEAADGLKHHGYDDLGSFGVSGADKWAANVFQAQGAETVQEIAFYTTQDDVKYRAFVYDLGTTAPSSPVAGTPLAEWSGTVANEGYHRMALPSPVAVGAGHYFSIVVQITLNNFLSSGPHAVERAGEGAVVNAEESWFSYDGTSWTDGATVDQPRNATIKAFTSEQGAPYILTGFLPNATLGQYYSATLEASGAKPIAWQTTSLPGQTGGSSLPPGLSLSSDGRISGTPTRAGTFYFAVNASNSEGLRTTVLSLTVEEASAAPTIRTTTLPNGKLKTAYSATLEASGATPITWTKASGTLPGGLTLSKDGVIKGTPTKEGVFGFTVKATNAKGSATKELSIRVGDTPKIVTERLDDAVVGKSYSVTLTAEGATPVTWTASGLPDGIKVSGNRLTGTPKATVKPGSYPVTLTAKHATLGSDTKTLGINVFAKPTITMKELPGGVVGENYEAQLLADGSPQITWEVTSKPAWLHLDGNYLRGSPATKVTANVTVKATNSYGSVTKSLRLVIGEAPKIETASLPVAFVGENYSLTLKTSAGTTPITWKVTGLPNNVTQKGATLSGKPAARGSYLVTITATNATGRTDTKRLTLRVEQKPTITTTELPGGVKGEPYGAALTASGTAPITWTVVKAPDWIRPNGSILSGIPPKDTTYQVTVKASNTIDGKTYTSAPKTFSILIGTRPVMEVLVGSGKQQQPLVGDTLPPATVGTNYSGNNITFNASGTKKITWTAIGLPDGMSLPSGGGKLSGKPNAGTAGTYTVTVTAANKIGTDTKTLTLVVGEKPTITTGQKLAGKRSEFPQSLPPLEATGTQPITWSVVGGALPDFWELSPDGVLSGRQFDRTWNRTKFDFTVEAKNAFGTSAKKKFTLYVSGEPEISTTSLPDAVLKKSYNFTMSVTADAELNRANVPITWEIVSGSLPLNITLNPTTGKLSGTPKETGTFRFTVKTKNAIGENQKQLTLTVK